MTLVNSTAYVVRAVAGTDAYGQAHLDWDDATTSSGHLTWFHQRSSTEVLAERDAEVTDALITLWDPSIDVAAHDRVVVVGPGGFGLFDVVGDPVVSSTPRGPHHLEVELLRVEG